LSEAIAKSRTKDQVEEEFREENAHKKEKKGHGIDKT